MKGHRESEMEHSEIKAQKPRQLREKGKATSLVKFKAEDTR